MTDDADGTHRVPTDDEALAADRDQPSNPADEDSDEDDEEGS